MRHVVFVVYAGLYPAYSKGEPLRSPYHFRPLLAVLFLHSLILFYGLRGDSGRGLCAVTHLREGRARADRAPSLATRHSCAHRDTNKHR